MEHIRLEMIIKKFSKKEFQHGYILLEAILAIAISSVVMMSLYQIFHSQQKNYITHDESYNMTQNLRAGIYLLTKEIRSAGFNPTNTDNGTIGFVANFDPANIFEDIGKSDTDYTTDKDRIAFGLDRNSDKCINADNKNASLIKCDLLTKDPSASVEDGERGEQIAYRMYNRELQRFNSEIYSNTGSVKDSWQTISTNVDALDFVFLDQDGNPINNPLNNVSQLREVEVSILIRTGKKDHKYRNTNIYRSKQGDVLCASCNNDHYHRRHLSTIVRLRNL
jgi:Tfp pilus assembly protein PilW